ncbi:MAG: hypothetical protein FJ395_21880 [Verrucomicrobia bacterium]|nr:hypothetical protein [Verrucomicrobiota bacterium]
MNNHIIFVALLLTGCAVQQDQPVPTRLKRADSFLGIHFDFHANTDCTNVGANTTPVMIENIIALVRPDYLQIDCKGHPGISSYPTKVGTPAPGIVGDPLRVWREVTAKHGVALYMHYSGVYERQAIRNPGWAAINADGKPNERATSFWGPYAEKLLIPQLRELAGDYGVDGAWVDGECWASVPDYSEPALQAFREATGIQSVPRKPGEPHWFEFLEFHREAFRKYLRHYIAEVKRTHPNFQLCSNWAFTDRMAEPVSAPVDFLSGDYSPQDSVNSARVSARYLARQGKPWDLMAWSFSTKPTRDQKTAVQLQREAAVVVALGGGFQAYFKQKRDGSIYDEQMPVMAEVAKFCRARQALCHRAEAVPQVALLFSTAGHYRKLNGLFPRSYANLTSALLTLLENQYSVEVLGEHHLSGRMSQYPLIVVPEWEYLEPKFKDQLVAYAKSGGKILLIGKSSGLLPAVRGIATTEVTGLLQRVRELFPEPMVEVSGSHGVDVCVARNHGKLLVNLVNTSGPHRTQSIIEAIPSVGALTVTIRHAKKPVKVTLEPAGQPLPFTYRDGKIQLTVPQVSIHEIIVVETK